MNYNQKYYIFNSEKKNNEAILLINIGSPETPSYPHVKSYLKKFLMDKYIISIPYIFRYFLVNSIIIPLRYKFSSNKYNQIWDHKERIFPLVKESISLAYNVSKYTNNVVSIAMRYSNPSIIDSIKSLKNIGRITKIRAVVLFPHYSNSTYKTAWEEVIKAIQTLNWSDVKLEFSQPFYDNKKYLKILSNTIKPHLTEPFDKLVVSYHGIPLNHLDPECRKNNGDPNHCVSNINYHKNNIFCYRKHVEHSFQLLIDQLEVSKDKAELVYQSRLGKQSWLKPYLWEREKQWIQEGTKKVILVCPGFITDCLETLSEINIDCRNNFLCNNDVSFKYIPCIATIEDFAQIIAKGDF